MSRKGTIFGVRVANVRLAAAAALTLFSLLAGHTVLEVARDALFLAHLPASELPFTYLAIALAAYVAARVDRRLSKRMEQRRLAMLTLAVAGVGTVGFYFAFGSDQWWVWWVPHFFYIWTGLVSTFAVAQFWRLLAELFTIVEAKKLYSRIAAGGSLGAVVGAAVAHFAQGWLEPRGLLLVGAGILAITACIPRFVFPPVAAVEASQATREASRGTPEEVAYVRRLLALVAIAAITAILVDYVFKSTIDAELEPDELAPFFSRFYVALNVVSLFVQIILAPRLLASLGATRALAVLPFLFVLGAVGHAVTGVLALAVLLRGADGALRHSLYRSAFELLYLPLTKAVRNRYKTLIDALGQRGGQAFGSLAILVVGLFGVGPRELGVAIAVLAAVWVALALSLRRRYLDRFRANLRAGSIETRVEVPQLDLGSLESVIASLNSHRDDEVLATLDLLADYHREALVPALLLYHPSRAVVLRTLDILATSDRTDYVSVARRLLTREDAEVQAAAMHAIAGLLSEAELREELEHDHPRAARAAVLVALVVRGMDEGDAAAELEMCASSDEDPVRVALARAIRLRADPSLNHYLDTMAGDAGAELRRELAHAYGTAGHPDAIPTLIEWLGPRGARAQARDALHRLGEPAYQALVEGLSNEEMFLPIRAHIPRTLSRFRNERCARALFDRLGEEPNGWVSYKILCALRPLRESMPKLRFDAREMTRLLQRELDRATHVLQLRVSLEAFQAEDPARLTRAGELLRPALVEKEGQALDRTVRMIALLHPNEDLRRITNALRHDNRRRRAESRELLTALAPASVAPALDALLDDAPDPDRLAALEAALEVAPPPEDYVGLLEALVGDSSESVRIVAARHIGELRLEPLRGPLSRSADRVEGLSLEVVARALEELDIAVAEAGRG